MKGLFHTMHADKTKLKTADTATLIHELSLIENEFADIMHPSSGARCTELYEYKTESIRELNKRNITK